MNEQGAKPRGGLRAVLLGDVDARAAAADAKLDRKFRKRQLQRDNAGQERAVAKQKRTARLAAFRAGVVNGAKTAVVVGPITAPMAVAWTGQIGFATSVLAWPFVGGVLYAAAYELTTVFCGWLYHEARKDGDGGIPYRLAMWAFAFGAAAQQWWHYLNPDGSASYRSVTFASMTLVGVIVFELFARLVHRRTLRRKGKVDDSRPRFGLVRWLRYPRRTFDAWSLTIQQPTRFNTVDLAWSAAEQAAIQRGRAKVARRIAKSARGLDEVGTASHGVRRGWRKIGPPALRDRQDPAGDRAGSASMTCEIDKSQPEIGRGQALGPGATPALPLRVKSSDVVEVRISDSNLVKSSGVDSSDLPGVDDADVDSNNEFEPTTLERRAVALLEQTGRAINRANCADAVRELDGAISTKRASSLAAWGRSNGSQRGPRAV